LAGELIFFEIGISPHAGVRRWQEWWEPAHRWLFEDLSLTRDTPALLGEGNLVVSQIEAGYLTPFPKSWAALENCRSWKGTATYYDAVVNGKTNRDAAWYYPTGIPC
jgi:hypothetical protein